MKKNTINILIVCVIMILLTVTVNPQKKKYTYLGVDKCTKKCHSSDAIGNQYKKWLSSPHAKAFYKLKTTKAKKIAKTLSIATPYKDLQCLKCHTTGKGKIPHTANEGVGCEACHGPGSEYHQTSKHVNFLDRKKGYLNGIRNGMYPVLSLIDGHLKKREKLCLSCHTNTRPCYPKNQRDLYMKKMTIQTIDQLRRGNVLFKHPLRK